MPSGNAKIKAILKSNLKPVIKARASCAAGRLSVRLIKKKMILASVNRAAFAKAKSKKALNLLDIFMFFIVIFYQFMAIIKIKIFDGKNKTPAV